MKFYLKYILLGVVIGLLILGLLSLAGCEETDATPFNAHDIEVTMRILAIENRLLAIEGSLDIQQTLSTDMWGDIENTKMILTTFTEAVKVDQQCVKTIQAVVDKLLDVYPNIVTRLDKLEAEPNKPIQTYLSDIDPNAPINTHLLKVSDSWAKEYGTSHESVSKYNMVAAWAFAQRALQQIAVLDKRLDPNAFFSGLFPIKLKANLVIECPDSDPNDRTVMDGWTAVLNKGTRISFEPVPISIKALKPEWIDPNEEKIITYNESGEREEWRVSERMIDGQPVKWLEPVDPNEVKE